MTIMDDTSTHPWQREFDANGNPKQTHKKRPQQRAANACCTDEELVARVKAIAKSENRSEAFIYRMFVQKGVEDYEASRHLTH